MKKYLAIKNNKNNFYRLLSMGYEIDSLSTFNLKKEYPWIFIIIIKSVKESYGCLTDGYLNKKTDIIVDINDIPKRKYLDEYVNVLINANKMGLL